MAGPLKRPNLGQDDLQQVGSGDVPSPNISCHKRLYGLWTTPGVFKTIQIILAGVLGLVCELSVNGGPDLLHSPPPVCLTNICTPDSDYEILTSK